MLKVFVLGRDRPTLLRIASGDVINLKGSLEARKAGNRVDRISFKLQ
jgi:hypothetical protein